MKMKQQTKSEWATNKAKLYTTQVFAKNREYFYNPAIRYIINQGGSRSSKTFSIAQLLIVYALTNKNQKVSVVRKAKTTLRNTAFKDFVDALSFLDESTYKINLTSLTITFVKSESTISFYGADKDQKLRGLKHDVVFANECNELSYEDFSQLDLRTTGKLIFDYNPSEEVKYIEEVLRDKDKSILIHSTYKDNAFLSDAQIRAIESFKEKDEVIYQIYTLGLPAVKKERIFTKLNSFTEWAPESNDYFVYGLDFGFNDPTSLVKCWVNDNQLYLEELIYESNLNTNQLIDLMNELNISKRHEIYPDISRPDLISSLEDEGYVFGKTNKDIKAGYSFMRNYQIYIHKDSYNLWKEFKNHNWKVIGGHITDKPVDFLNHAIDASRYAAYSHFNRPNTGVEMFLVDF